MITRDQFAEALWEEAAAAMPPWQAKLFRRMLKAWAQGRTPRTIHWPPRGTLPAITIHHPTPRPRRSRRHTKPRPQQIILL